VKRDLLIEGAGLMRVILITDLHFGARNDNPAFLTFYEKFYNNCFFPKLVENNITHVLILGDTFDRRKYVNFNTLKKTKEMFFDRLQEMGIEVFMLAGNHDTYFKNTNEVNSIDLLLAEYGNIHVIDDPEEIYIGPHKICMIPWICAENVMRTTGMIDRTDATLCMGHFEIQGFAMYKGMESHEGLNPSMFDKFDMVFSGHYHHRSDNGHIYYLGNPYELTWQDFDDPRGFHLFDLNKRELEFIQNPYKMFYKVYYDDLNKKVEDVIEQDFSQYKESFVKVIVKNKTNPYWFDLFIEKLEKVGLVDLQVVEDHLNLNLEADDEIVNEAEDTMTILTKYIDSIELDIDRKRLDKLIRTLYDEALSIE